MESPDHERRSVSEYVEIEAPGQTVTRAEKISEYRAMTEEFDVWDVETDKDRWWVVTNPTNLYRHADFPSMDQVLSLHLGLRHRIFAREATAASGRTGEEEAGRLPTPWREWEQAAEASEMADEAAEFQAVGMRCREALLTFVSVTADEAMVPEGVEVPKKADFVHWSEHIAAAITPTAPRLRAYLRNVASSTWELVSWLTHNRSARRFDAILAVDATAHVLDTFGMALVRHERGEPERCPMCNSYRLTSDYRTALDVYVTLCEVCGWESGPETASSNRGG